MKLPRYKKLLKLAMNCAYPSTMCHPDGYYSLLKVNTFTYILNLVRQIETSDGTITYSFDQTDVVLIAKEKI